jgi:hypothetical protein
MLSFISSHPYFAFSSEEELGNTALAQQILTIGTRYMCQLGKVTEAEGLALRYLRLIPRGDSASVQLIQARRVIGIVINAHRGANKVSTPNSQHASTWWPQVRVSGGDGSDVDEMEADPGGDARYPYRVMLEGALLEYRGKRLDLALGILMHLISHMPSRAQPIVSLVDLLRKECRWSELDRWLTYGLRNLPNASVLYFEALKVIRQSNAMIALTLEATEIGASANLSPELVWKFYLDLAQHHADQGHTSWSNARKALAKAARHAPKYAFA